MIYNKNIIEDKIWNIYEIIEICNIRTNLKKVILCIDN